MKFTKEDVYKELVNKIPNKGQTLNLSERSINEQLEALMPLLSNDETELSDFVQNVLPFFKTADANVRNDVSAGIREYQEKNPHKVEPKGNEGPSEEVLSLMSRIDELEKKNAENEKKSIITNRRNEISSKMREKGVKDKEWINLFLDQVSIDGDNFDIDANVESFVKVYNKSLSFVDPDVTPDSAGGGKGKDKELGDLIKGAAAFVKSQRLE